MSTALVPAEQTRSSLRRDRRATPRGFRPDIQALRAIAIVAVVLNHFWPARVTGGYIGVDVFFVISGFLITAHLMREVIESGRVALGRFYARRIRRLLPAAVFVLVISAVGVLLFVPYPRWSDNGLQLIASASYFENWVLAAQSIDYSAHNASASAMQHYWSLSVEEQFYLVWPLLISLVAPAAWLLPRRSVSARIAALVVVVGVLSLAASVLYTTVAPEQAYFVTFTRAWQFAAGAAVAIVASRLRFGPRLAIPLALAGLAGIGVSIFAFDASTPYPGFAAVLPVVATVAVVIAGSAGSVLALDRIYSWRPIQWLGEVSYSLYLWHWPVLVILPLALHRELDTVLKIILLILALLLAWATRRFIEAPAQRAEWWRSSVSRSMTAMVAMVATCAIVGAGMMYAGASRAEAAADLPPVTGACAGPAALLSGDDCEVSAPLADPVVPPSDAYFALAPECAEYDDRLAMDDRQTTRQCDFGGDDPAARVWLVGDSHALQWQSPLFDIARDRQWNLTVSTFDGCPAADVAFQGFRSAWGPADQERCREWATQLTEAVANDAPDAVFTSMTARLHVIDDGSGRTHNEQFVAGLRETWSTWAETGALVIPIADVPFNGDVRAADCLILAATDPGSCARPRTQALPADPLMAAAEGQASVAPIDLSSAFCDADDCFAAVGGMPVFYDADHISRAYSVALRPAIEAAIPGSLTKPVG